ncbi:LysR family transcriptional regulator [Chelatococcus sambhunathii]|uniref:LysR family transcriptional regulator n=1 Tax=Chelatococcus sambhunathii TaxID=363953 RepID=A0ABU1DEN9_9HYPH|nr:LysR family transcriptional regulator [Chelatococcus sambhunathii]MDR4306586.1 LysR family transcriptional regulator [Chelatococcus sambhunathii]
MSVDARLLSGIGVMVAVVDQGGFARAGDELGLTPSGVSRAIARLEAQLQVRLFHRTPRRVELTEEGRRFHAEVSPLLAAIRDAAEDAGSATATVRGRLKVNTDPWFARVILAPRLPELLRLHPELQLEFVISNHREEMMHGGVDVAVRFGSPPNAAMIARKLLETRIVTCAAPAYLARRGTPQSPADVAQHDVLLFRNPETGRPFPWKFHRAGSVVETKVAGRVVMDDPSAALAACEAGSGLFQSFELGLAPWLRDGRLTQVLTDWADERFPLYAFYPSRRQTPAKVRAFLDFVGRICRTDAAPGS